MNSSSFRAFAQRLKTEAYVMPVLFIGHGSPMNGIEDNRFSQQWAQLARDIPTPSAVLCVSAHWLTRGTHITAMEQPRTIHDFGGFPRALFDVEYPAPGNPALAQAVTELVKKTPVGLDHEWGLDHGTWTVVRHMFPEANVPVLQLSLNYHQPLAYHYELAKELYALRKKGVLIIGSGNMVHNLRLVSWEMIHGGGYDWALHINETFKGLIRERDHHALIQYEKLGSEAQLAIPTPDHYLPLLYTLGLQQADEEATFFNDQAVGGSLTMTSVKIG
ncbi:4,5-DOPA dioxygenase extradiol [Catalinimonas alkaloidigena]|nr:4,5-DOPA dioxygenase extradiol [Catalinimonas alkaloidigena]